MPGLIFATGVLAFLADEEPELKVYALQTLNDDVDTVWTEVAGSLSEMYVENKNVSFFPLGWYHATRQLQCLVTRFCRDHHLWSSIWLDQVLTIISLVRRFTKTSPFPNANSPLSSSPKSTIISRPTTTA